jgi:hypothetical protein
MKIIDILMITLPLILRCKIVYPDVKYQILQKELVDHNSGLSIES